MFDGLRYKSYRKDIEKFCSLLEPNSEARLLDVGCGDGIKTWLFAKAARTNKVVGVDIKKQDVTFECVEADLENGITIGASLFDVVTSYHVIEHISRTDLLVQEIYRILRPGGYLVMATPNLASGRVILELLMNKQPNTAHVSDYFIIRGDPGGCWRKSIGYLHRRLFTIEGLVRLLTYYGFKIEATRGTGYGPLPLSWLPRGLYAADIIVKARKV